MKDYRAGELERRYESLGIEENFFVNYGYVTRAMQAWMHPRPDLHVPADGNHALAPEERKRETLLLKFVAALGAVHPREVEENFAHGTVRNYWGGSSHATTQMLDALHYRGLLRVARREKGIRLHSPQLHGPAPEEDAARRARIDALVDAVVNLYAPLTNGSLSFYIRRLRHAVPQWSGEITAALQRARERLAHARVDGVEWFWPNEENPRRAQTRERVRLLAPFDPVVHDRKRFELFWGWAYRFETYTPAPKRKLGYYALPLLWRDRVIGWANLALKDGCLTSALGYADGRSPREKAFSHELEAELGRMRVFLGANVP